MKIKFILFIMFLESCNNTNTGIYESEKCQKDTSGVIVRSRYFHQNGNIKKEFFTNEENFTSDNIVEWYDNGTIRSKRIISLYDTIIDRTGGMSIATFMNSNDWNNDKVLVKMINHIRRDSFIRVEWYDNGLVKEREYSGKNITTKELWDSSGLFIKREIVTRSVDK
jgi:hypothetical protein